MSHTEGLVDLSRSVMEKEGVNTDYIRLVDYDIPHGESPDMTQKNEAEDEWPELFERIFKADILIVATPIWLGELSSVAKKFIERMDAMNDERTNEKGQYLFYGKAAGCLVTGNEDGIKNCAKTILFAMQHLGYSIPPQADAGWIGPVGPGPSYLDKKSGALDHEFTNRNTTFLTYNLMHLASYLKEKKGYPAYGNSFEQWNNGERWNFEKLSR